MVISVVVKTVEVVKDATLLVTGDDSCADVIITGMLVVCPGELLATDDPTDVDFKNDEVNDTITLLAEDEASIDGLDTITVVGVELATIDELVIAVVIGGEDRIFEELSTGEDETITTLLVGTEAEGVVSIEDEKVDGTTLLVGVLTGNVEAGVEADWQSKPTL